MTMIRRAILALALAAGIVPAIAAPPPPVPALPDTERRTSYSINTSTCACAVNFALFGDAADYQNWIEVWLNGVSVAYNDPIFGWNITSPTGALGSIPLPITDAVMTFNFPQTGTVQIVGARRPRRVTQFQENRGVPARDLNQALTDVIAQNRETWDRTNDVVGRALMSQPGNTVGNLPLPSVCKGALLGFDATTGLKPVCVSNLGSGNVTLPVNNGDFACFSGTTGQLQDCASAPNSAVNVLYTAPGTGGVSNTQATVNARWVFASDYGVTNDGTNIQKTVSTTSGGSTLTVSTAQFASTDCNSGTGCTGATNKSIMVTGAGAAGAPYVGTITGFTSSTVVTVSGTFGTTLVSSSQIVTYGTDNTTKLQNWINRIGTSGAIGIFDSGTYATTQPLSITSSVRIIGSGQSSILLLISATSDAIDINTDNPVSLRSFSINGSTAATAGNMISNTGPIGSGNQGSEFIYLNVTGGFRGYEDISAYQYTIENSIFAAQTAVGIQTANAAQCAAGNIFLRGNTINIPVSGTYSAGLLITDSGIIFNGNKINGGTGGSDILIQPASTCTIPSDVIIADNSLEGGPSGCIQMTKGSFTGSAFPNIVISNNEVGCGGANGVIIGDSNTNWIKHLNISGNQIYGTTGTGLVLTNSVLDASVVGNTFTGANTGLSVGSTVGGVARANSFDSTVATFVSSSSPNFLAEVNFNGHVNYAGVAPSISSCGAGSAVGAGSTDNAGQVTVASVVTACGLNFAKAYQVAPKCVASNIAGGTAIISVLSTTSQLTLNFASSSGQTFAWVCHGT